MLVLRETWLPPGRYTVEIAVQDAFSGRLGVQRTPLEIAAAAEAALRVSAAWSSSATRRRAAKVRAESPALVAQGMQIYPSAGAAVVGLRRTAAALLPRRAARRRAGPRRRRWSSCARARRRVFSAPMTFVQAIGRSTLLGGVPLEGLAPGDYELRVTVGDGVDRAVRWAKVTLAP